MEWIGVMALCLCFDTPVSFTAANAASMSDSGWEECISGIRFSQSYTIPFSGDVDATDPDDQARTRVEEKISIEQLETDIAAGGAGDWSYVY